jgi:hypothetical protein
MGLPVVQSCPPLCPGGLLNFQTNSQTVAFVEASGFIPGEPLFRSKGRTNQTVTEIVVGVVLESGMNWLGTGLRTVGDWGLD